MPSFAHERKPLCSRAAPRPARAPSFALGTPRSALRRTRPGQDLTLYPVAADAPVEPVDPIPSPEQSGDDQPDFAAPEACGAHLERAIFVRSAARSGIRNARLDELETLLDLDLDAVLAYRARPLTGRIARHDPEEHLADAHRRDRLVGHADRRPFVRRPVSQV